EGTYIMNSRDMCMIEHIPKLVEAGITSFKIEGRAKSAYYTGVVTNAYRAAIDEYKKSPTPDFMPSKWILDEMGKVSYREYCTGFYFGHPSEDAQIFYDGIYKRDWDVVGIVEDYKDGYLFAEQRNKFCEGDFLEVLQKGEPPFEIKVTNLRDSNGEAVESVPHPLMKLSFKCDKEIIKGSILRKMR
ncbi:MAG: U32 family peptidase C-terminal domain-containing protein, partial [Clostridia bacterium]|nr:U32 family peptidase C-terminal domain-containing protein [Clostridia bacterium]